MRLVSIASGSSGNCIYIDNDESAVLIDTGISRKRIFEGIESIGASPDKIRSILITHEHCDHIAGLAVTMKQLKVPVYATMKTFDAIMSQNKNTKMDTSLFHCITPNNDFSIDGFNVRPFSVSHDAADPVCYTVCDPSGKAAVATDLGYYDEYIVSCLTNSNILLLESNHDINMVQVGSYPYSLKKRILSEKGHLSNEGCASLITRLAGADLTHVILGHLSRENNYPLLAYETVKAEVKARCGDYIDRLDLQVAGQYEPCRMVSI